MKTSSLIKEALAEDLGQRGDVTTKFFVPAHARLSGTIVAKQPGVICGTKIAARVFNLLGCRAKILVKDGSRVARGRKVMTVSGGRALLTAERTALNFLQHLSGVSSLTRLYADKVRGTRAKIYDTRKTLPGWRALDKYAVRCGGGKNHRMGLYDAVLVKDNHWASGVDVVSQVKAVRRKHPGTIVELEAADMRQVGRALFAKPDIILLDNMSPSFSRKAISSIRKALPKCEIEISGGVDLTTVRSLAGLGPDRISIGRLTHSAPALDLSLEVA
ncbi:MAG: carboxylating nicotinate-nucleotide diphosphorylase [Elusimicrobia bacterium]|nr:carboxylating nicotinate-nucleotide diphosphorylase [Elusimicrobiota bacterium]